MSKNTAPDADAMRALLKRNAEAAASEEGNDKESYYRKKRAKEFAQHFVFVTDFIAELREAEPDIKITETLIGDKLNELWSAKAEIKNEREF